jgi:hypothetical protein
MSSRFCCSRGKTAKSAVNVNRLIMGDLGVNSGYKASKE